VEALPARTLVDRARTTDTVDADSDVDADGTLRRGNSGEGDITVLAAAVNGYIDYP
jgi:hypothetical protein